MKLWRHIIPLFSIAFAACQDVLPPQPAKLLLNMPASGMTKDEVIGQLGPPHRQEHYGATEFLFYNTNWAMADVASQRSPFAVVNGKVIAAGKSFYDAFIKSQSNWHGTVSDAP